MIYQHMLTIHAISFDDWEEGISSRRESDINILVIVPLIFPFYLIESYLGLPSWIPCRTFESMIFRDSLLVGYGLVPWPVEGYVSPESL